MWQINGELWLQIKSLELDYAHFRVFSFLYKGGLYNGETRLLNNLWKNLIACGLEPTKIKTVLRVTWRWFVAYGKFPQQKKRKMA